MSIDRSSNAIETERGPVVDSPIRLRRVAAALDGFAEGRDAAVLAAAISRLAGAELRLLAVHPDPVVVMPPGMRWHDLRADAEKHLRGVRDELGLALSTPISIETGWSVPRALKRVVVRDRVDLLVLGSSRHAPTGHVQIGRVTALGSARMRGPRGDRRGADARCGLPLAGRPPAALVMTRWRAATRRG